MSNTTKQTKPKRTKATATAAPKPKSVPNAKGVAKRTATPSPKARPAPLTVSRAPDTERAALVEGSIIDRRFVVRRVIATGGMGVVLEVEHLHTHRRHAIKAHRGTRQVPVREQNLLLDEAAALSATRHPNVLEVFDAGVCPTFGPFVVLEALEGRSVETLLTTRGRLPLEDVLSIMQQLSSALDHVHARGYIHRDVKPGNLIVARGPLGTEIVKLIDFGLALPLATQYAARANEDARVVGTADYMAPEQRAGRSDDLDARCDVFGAAVILYELLTGELPRDGSQSTTFEPVSRRRPELGTRFDDVLAHALAPNRYERTRSLGELFDALERVADVPLRATRLLAGLDVRDVPERAGPETINVDPSELEVVDAVPPLLPADVRARRKQPRVPFGTPVRVAWSGHIADGRSDDVSEGGMLVMIDATPEPNSDVTLHFDVPGTNTRAAVSCRVQWVKPGRRRTAVGLEFLSIGDPIRRAIAALTTLGDDASRPDPSKEEKEGGQ